MRITLAAVLLLVLAGAAGAEPSTLFYNTHGQITGSASSSGNVVTFRDRSGKMVGTSERTPSGTIFRNRRRQAHGFIDRPGEGTAMKLTAIICVATMLATTADAP